MMAVGGGPREFASRESTPPPSRAARVSNMSAESNGLADRDRASHRWEPRLRPVSEPQHSCAQIQAAQDRQQGHLQLWWKEKLRSRLQSHHNSNPHRKLMAACQMSFATCLPDELPSTDGQREISRTAHRQDLNDVWLPEKPLRCRRN